MCKVTGWQWRGNSIVSLQQVWALVWLPHQINFTWKQFKWGLTLSLSCSQSPALCELLHRFDASVYLCLYERAYMTQTYFLKCYWESVCHNRRKLPPLSHKPDVLLQEVRVTIGNIPLCYSVKVLDPNTAAVYSCSESERSSGRCPPLLWHQQTPSEKRSPWQEASVTTLSSEVMFWIVSWGKPREGSLPVRPDSAEGDHVTTPGTSKRLSGLQAQRLPKP